MQAIILAGGFGTRLKSTIGDVPKPMAPIHDKPFLAYLLDYLSAQGFKHVILSVHHLYEQIIDFFGDRYDSMIIDYAIESSPLGTGGAIVASVREFNLTTPFFVLNGDTFFDIEYQKMWLHHKANVADLTMALTWVTDSRRYGLVKTDRQYITEFCEKNNNNQGGMINAGIYLINPTLFVHHNLPPQFSFENDFLVPNVAQLKPHYYTQAGSFLDIGVPEDYYAAFDLFQASIKTD